MCHSPSTKSYGYKHTINNNYNNPKTKEKKTEYVTM